MKSEKHAAQNSERGQELKVHRLLKEHLCKHGLSAGDAPSALEWAEFLEQVSTACEESDRDRQAFEESILKVTDESSDGSPRTEDKYTGLSTLLTEVASHLGAYTDSLAIGGAAIDDAREELVAAFDSKLVECDEFHAAEAAALRTLCDEMARMGASLSSLAEQASNSGHLKNQLELAGTIQELMLPPAEISDHRVLRVSSTYKPAAYCGGDWWSMHEIDEHQTMMIVGDVSGHGVTAAVMASASRGACDAIAHEGPLAVMESIHNLLVGPEKGRLATTCVVGVVDQRDSTLEILSAGHPFALIIGEDGKIRPVIAKGSPLGLRKGKLPISVTLPFNPGNTLVLFTDGITECRDNRGKIFGDRGLRAAIRKNLSATVDEIREGIIDELGRHRGDKDLEDDITLVVARRL